MLFYFEMPLLLNFNDALIALACEELDVSVILSFDGDFDHIAWLKRIADFEGIDDALRRGPSST